MPLDYCIGILLRIITLPSKKSQISWLYVATPLYCNKMLLTHEKGKRVKVAMLRLALWSGRSPARILESQPHFPRS